MGEKRRDGISRHMHSLKMGAPRGADAILDLSLLSEFMLEIHPILNHSRDVDE